MSTNIKNQLIYATTEIATDSTGNWEPVGALINTALPKIKDGPAYFRFSFVYGFGEMRDVVRVLKSDYFIKNPEKFKKKLQKQVEKIMKTIPRTESFTLYEITVGYQINCSIIQPKPKLKYSRD